MAIHNYAEADVKLDLYNTIPGDGIGITLMGNSTRGDIDPSVWLYDASSMAADNYPEVIRPTLQTGNGRWLRKRPEQVQSDWNESDTSSNAYIQNKPGILGMPTVASIAAGARNFNTPYQVDADQYADIRACADIQCSLSLAGGQSGEVFLEYSADGSTGWTLAGKLSGSNTGTLTIGLNTTQITGGQLSTILEPGYYWRLRTNNISGTPTYTFTGGTQIVY